MDQLKAVLEGRGVPSFAYCIGREENESYCVTRQDDGWHVFYSERGSRNNERVFGTEDEACRELLDRITSDGTLQRYMEERRG